MSGMSRPEENSESEMETARIGYQVYANLWTFQSSLNWNRFGAMLTANSIVIAAIAVILSGQTPLPLLRGLFPVVGLVLCAFWTALMARGHDYHRHWIQSARKLEETYLSDVLTAISESESGKIQFNWLSRSPLGQSQDVAIYGVIVVFAVVYLVALFVP
jgi:hypothetical protein